ncbi:MAG TPA: oxidoreductase [Candidatus Moranbacteria bacterium]|nr:MAG: DoxX family protein [Candidatus Moranbacteria bacterium GW2011_GWC2_45_10]KKT93414.1 MAG: DoxX family protein [Parcubacteria group bacterium GW2011_GWC1_45_14]HAV11462.1 oxidoreductase [Candidatus Moranbacteria bacterium]
MKYLEKINNPDLGLLLVRVALALVFIVHGYAKLTGLAGTEAFFGRLGLPVFFVYLVTFVEFFGGFAMLLGIFSRIFGWLLAINMLFAIYLVKFSQGFSGGYEFELTLLLISLAIAFAGSGRYSLMKEKTMMS